MLPSIRQLTITTKAIAFVSLALCYVPAVHADTFGSGSNTFGIDFVAIGDTDNVADTTGNPNPAGAVGYEYRIGKYEISEQMVNKANAQSILDGDPLGITIDNRGPDKPATRASWFEAAQFVNWLNTDSGSAPAYKFDNNGDFQLWLPGDTGYNPNNLYRNSQAKYFLPSVDEWYKAAYYDAATGVYYDFTTGSDSVPDGIDFAGDTTFDAVFFDGGSNSAPNDITDVGVLSPYGTAGQGGNVFEWEETESDLVNDSTSAVRGIGGGFWGSNSLFLSSLGRGSQNPLVERDSLGFRVASIAVPEPTTLSLAAFTLLAIAYRRRLR